MQEGGKHHLEQPASLPCSHDVLSAYVSMKLQLLQSRDPVERKLSIEVLSKLGETSKALSVASSDFITCKHSSLNQTG